MQSRQIIELRDVSVRDPFAASRHDLSAIRDTLDREQARLTDIAAMLDRAWEAIHESQSRVTSPPR
ncbi:MAG TPA: hypothetical protein VIG44_04175 [Thermomicrobiales bacterium]|jgi:hypothetical protein